MKKDEQGESLNEKAETRRPSGKPELATKLFVQSIRATQWRRCAKKFVQ